MKGLKLLFFLVVILVAIPLITLSFFGGPIARSLVGTLNDRLQTEISIQEYDVRFWSTFPNLSVGLTGVEMEGSDGSELLRADHIDFLVDLESLFGKVRVEAINVRDGRLQLLADLDGNTNWQIAGYTPHNEQAIVSEAPTEPTEFAIARALLENMAVVYRDDQLGIDLVGTLEELSFSGDFGADNYLLTTEGVIDVEYLDQEGDRYVYHQQLALNAATQVDNKTGVYTLAPLRVEAGDLDLNIVGTLQPTREGLATNFRVESQSGSLADVIKLVPPAYVGNLTELETRGELDLSATVDGEWSQTAYPRIEGQLNFTGGRIGSPRTNVGIRDLDLRAIFTYLEGPRGGVQSFRVEEFTGNFRGEPFDLRLSVENIANPKISFGGNGAFSLGALPALLGEGPVSAADGFLRLEDVRIEGLYRDMLAPRSISRVAASGRINFDAGELTINDRALSFPSGSLLLKNNELEITDLQFSGPGTDLEFSGRAINLIPVLFADSLNTSDAELQFQATLAGKRLDLDELLALAGPTEAEEEAAAEAGATDSLRAKTVENRIQLSDLLRGSFTGRIDAWNYEEIEGRDFEGSLEFTPGALTVRGQTNAMGGDLLINGDVFFAEKLRLEGRVVGEQVDVREFFTQGQNFSQEVLTATNLRGTMGAELWIEAAFDDAGDFDFDALKVLAHLNIRDGELVDFAMLEDFAFALKAKDLERVRFTELDNYFEISKQRLFIPAMKIQSSALNLELAGEHSFEQEMNYFIKVNAGQAIANKLSRHDEELEVLPERRGWFNLYYSMSGTTDDLTVELDKRGVKQAFKTSLARRNRIATLLEGRGGVIF